MLDGHAHGAQRPMQPARERGHPARAAAPRARCRPPPGPAPAGGWNPAPPPGGGRLGGGQHAANGFHLSRPCGSAAQRRNAHTVVPGRAAPSQTLPRVGAWGNPVSPCPCGAGAWEHPVSPHPLREPMFTVAVHAAPPHNAAMNIRLFLGGLRPPTPSRGWGHGETRCPHFPAGRGRGETRVPHTPLREPMFTVAVHAARAAQRRNEHKFVLGRALPSQTLPAGRGRGETRFPHTPLRGATPHITGIRLFLGGLRPPRPSRELSVLT